MVLEFMNAMEDKKYKIAIVHDSLPILVELKKFY